LDLADMVGELREAERRHRVADRPLEVSVTPHGPVDAATVERFGVLGVDRLLLPLPGFGREVEPAISFVADSAALIRSSQG
jgi:hypothetical protein